MNTESSIKWEIELNRVLESIGWDYDFDGMKDADKIKMFISSLLKQKDIEILAWKKTLDTLEEKVMGCLPKERELISSYEVAGDRDGQMENCSARGWNSCLSEIKDRLQTLFKELK